MSISTELSRIRDAKAAIRTAIIGKGVNVPEAAKIDTYADRIDSIVQTASGNMEVVVSNPTGTINAIDNRLYMLNATAGAMVFNLPVMQTSGHGILLLMETDSLSAVSFTSADNSAINFPSGFQVEADKCYLMDFEYVNSAWTVTVDEWFVNGGGSLPQYINAITYNDYGMPTYVYLTDIALADYKHYTGLSYCKTLERVKYEGTTLYDTTGPNSNYQLYGFQQCSNLKYVDMPNLTTSHRDTYFRQCTSLTDLSLPKLTTVAGSFLEETPNIRRISMPEIETLPDYMFRSNNMLNKVYIPKAKTIGTGCFANTNYSGCSGNFYLTLPSTVTSVGSNAFDNGQIIVTFEGTTPPSCGSNMFQNNCFPIYVPSASVDAYKTTTNLAQYADRIKPIGWTPTVPEGAKVHIWKNNGFDTIAEDNSGTLTASEYSSYKSNGGYVILSNTITSLKKDTFNSATSLRRIYMPSVTTLEDNTYSQYGTFYNCSKLVEIDLTNVNVMSDGRLQYRCFYNCSMLYKVKLPASMTNFYYASNSDCSPFYGCPRLSEIWIYSTTVPQSPHSSYTFKGCTEINSLDPDRASIYVLPELVDAYKSATGWSAYSAIIKAMPA